MCHLRRVDLWLGGCIVSRSNMGTQAARIVYPRRNVDHPCSIAVNALRGLPGPEPWLSTSLDRSDEDKVSVSRRVKG